MSSADEKDSDPINDISRMNLGDVQASAGAKNAE
jgi:hypothetical protein